MPQESCSVPLLRTPIRSAVKTLPFVIWTVASLLLYSGVAAAVAQSNSTSVAATSTAGNANLELDPRSWAADAAANELKVLHHPGSYLRYKMHVHDDKGDQVRDVIECKDGTVARLILRDGKPLNEVQDKAERDRLSAMLSSPSTFERHIHNDDRGKKLADDLIQLMPNAMVYTYVPEQPQTGNNHGQQEIVLDYEPNPKFKPPTTTSQALTGLKGRVWIDAKTRHVVRMEGTIFQGINFGWGMVAHIYPGGKLVLEQTNAGGQRWIFNHFKEQVSARALMVKSLNVRADIDADEFQVMPGPLSYQDAIRLLLDTPLPTH